MAQVQISQLPSAGAITGSELVPVVQNGVTVKTTTGAIAASPAQTQTFITLNQEPSLPNSRYLSTGTGLGLVDGGAQSFYRLTLNGTSGSLETAGIGLIAKTGGAAVTARTLTASGAGIAVSDGDGVAGNPTVALSGLPLALANTGGTGFLAVVGGTVISGRQFSGAANQITISDGNGAGNPVISIASDPVLPGTGSVQVPSGTAAQQPAGSNGNIRYNTDTNRFEGYQNGWNIFGIGDGTVTSVSGTGNQITVVGATTTPIISITPNPVLPGFSSVTIPGGATGLRPIVPTNGMLRYNSDTGLLEAYLNNAWVSLASGSGVTSVATGTGLLGGPITSTGTISIDPSVVVTLSDTQTLTNKTLTLPVIAQISNTGILTLPTSTDTLVGRATADTLTNKTLTLPVISQIVNTGTLTLPTSTDTLVGRATTDTLTNKTIDGVTNTLQNIPNAALSNSSVTVGTTSISLGGSSLTLGGLTSVAVTQNPTLALQLATKQYVDALVSSGITYHSPVKYEVPNTTGNLNATYNNGAAGVGATLTNAGTLAAFAPDGPTAQVGDRILIYNQTNQFENGVYEVLVVGDGSTAWVLTRTSDADTYALKSINGLGEGDAFFITSGNTGAGETYVCNTQGTITFGTTAITFAQISSAQVYSAGTGLTLTGTQFSITNTGVSAATYGSASQVPVLAVNAQGQLTSVTNTSIAINGNQITSGTVGVAYGGTNIASYSAGDLLYASASTTLSRLAIGATDYVLTSTGTAPQYVAQSTLSVGSATTAGNATTATNIAGGIASQIPYQTGAGATSFIANGTAGQVLTSNGTSVPTWSGISGGTF